MDKTMRLLLDFVKKGKKYSSISDNIIEKEIQNYFKKNSNSKKFLERPKSNKFKIIIKEIRAELHKKHASFEKKEIQKRGKYLDELKKNLKENKSIIKDTNKNKIKNKIKNINKDATENKLKFHKKLLNISISSKERLPYYSKLYKKIFKITGKPKIITDFGCGINPISFPFMNLNNNKIKYFAYEISKDDVNFLNKYFKIEKNIVGKAELIDLQKANLSNADKFPKSNVAFLFKVADVVETKGHKISEKIIKKINSDYVVVSFATKTLSGRAMNHPQRGWIERMLTRLGYLFKIIKFYNEIYYVVDKRKIIKNK